MTRIKQTSLIWTQAKVITLLLFAIMFSQSTYANKIEWKEFDKVSFELAKKQDKFIILDLVAVWCHWCHVMEKNTYTDEKVVSLLNNHFITTQADHDLRPDLAERYRNWGWPATIVLTPDGTEIVKRAGYISPGRMARLLQAIIEDPSPETTTLTLPNNLSSSPKLEKSLVQQLKIMHLQAYDSDLGSLQLNMKFLDIDSVEWDLYLATKGDASATNRVIKTLDNAKQIIDPEFGGAYQYSTNADWQHPHYEKIMNTQYKNMYAFASACQQLQKQRYCVAAKQVADYLLEFLYSTDKGVFYSSQDADLKQGEKSHDYFKLKRQQRLALGIPKVDKHKYSSHNGKAIEGMIRVYMATKEKKYLVAAIKASDWIIKHRKLNNGGFKHDRDDTVGPFLADTLYMARAFLLLNMATNDPKYIDYANQAAVFILLQFKNPKGGLISAVDNGTPTKPLPQLDQNIDAARFFMQLYSKSPSMELNNLIDHTMKLLATPEIATSRFTDPGILLAHKTYNILRQKQSNL